MFKRILDSNTVIPYGLDFIRILSGLIIISFGMEIIDPDKIASYTEWTTDVGIPFPNSMVYIGKLAELIGGVCLTLGLWTRIASIPLVITMFVITFIMLDGSILTGSFYLLLIFAIFFFAGSGQLSIDSLLKNRKA